MAIAAAEVFNVDFTGAGDHEVIPAVAGKSVRVWRMVLTANVVGDDPIVARFTEDDTPLAGTFLVFRGSGFGMGAEARSWITATPGVSVGIHTSSDCRIAGSMLAEYI